MTSLLGKTNEQSDQRGPEQRNQRGLEQSGQRGPEQKNNNNDYS
jgi:hypothetical protein